MAYFAQPPNNVTSFVPDVCTRGEGRGAEALKPKGAWDNAVPEGEEYSAPGPASSR